MDNSPETTVEGYYDPDDDYIEPMVPSVVAIRILGKIMSNGLFLDSQHASLIVSTLKKVVEYHDSDENDGRLFNIGLELHWTPVK